MRQFLAAFFLLYMAVCSALVPVFVFYSAVAAHDCSVMARENCVWVIVPASHPVALAKRKVAQEEGE